MSFVWKNEKEKNQQTMMCDAQKNGRLWKTFLFHVKNENKKSKVEQLLLFW